MQKILKKKKKLSGSCRIWLFLACFHLFLGYFYMFLAGTLLALSHLCSAATSVLTFLASFSLCLCVCLFFFFTM